jgi:hypothetical protein
MNTTQSIEAAWPKLDRLQMFSNVSYERGTGGGVLGVEFSKTVAKDVTADVCLYCRLATDTILTNKREKNFSVKS